MSTKTQRGLGRGLEALMGSDAHEERPSYEISLNLIDVNEGQARKSFDADKLQELARSIEQHGIIQPLILKKKGERYTIIAGERRYRAARKLGLARVPAVVKDVEQNRLLELSIIENIQREDLNAIEEANAIMLLMNEHGYTQEAVSARIGRSRSAVANTLRLLNLPENVKDLVKTNELSAGHARALVALGDQKRMSAAAAYTLQHFLSVRQTEEYVKKLLSEKKPKQPKEQDVALKDAQNMLSQNLETKVRIVGGQNKGRIVIEYFSKEQLEGLYEKLTD